MNECTHNIMMSSRTRNIKTQRLKYYIDKDTQLTPRKQTASSSHFVLFGRLADGGQTADVPVNAAVKDYTSTDFHNVKYNRRAQQ